MRCAAQILVALFAIASGVSANSHCANHQPSPERLAEDERLMGLQRPVNSDLVDHVEDQKDRFDYRPEDIVIEVFFHILYEDKDEGGGWVSENRINQSVQVLNDGFRQTGISFNLIGWEYHQHGDYANARRPMDMKGWLRYGDYKTMNVYSLKRLQGKWLMGDTYFPTDLHRAPSGSRYYIADGIMIMADTLAGGTYKDYSKGVNLIHEAGHWFGLYHTFEGGCASQPNDFVADTPPSNGPNWKCDESRHTCGDQPEHDAIHNYMDYSPDECKWEFTPGQIDRMRLQYAVYRNRTYSNE